MTDPVKEFSFEENRRLWRESQERADKKGVGFMMSQPVTRRAFISREDVELWKSNPRMRKLLEKAK